MSTAIQQQAEVLEQRKEKQLSRQVRITTTIYKFLSVTELASSVERIAKIVNVKPWVSLS